MSISFILRLLVDDLLLFAKADVKFVTCIRDVFHEFSLSSGLSANLSKCSVYLAGVNQSIKNDILDILGMDEGFFPFKYLGIPLYSKKLNAMDCKMIVDRITRKLRHWTTRMLTYAGKIELIRSVEGGCFNF